MNSIFMMRIYVKEKMETNHGTALVAIGMMLMVPFASLSKINTSWGFQNNDSKTVEAVTVLNLWQLLLSYVTITMD